MDLVGIAHELHALLPEEFTAARNAQAKEAASGGDKDLAARIKALRKPSAAAWLVNMLARHKPDEIGSVIDLGRAMSEAQEQLDAAELRTLGAQRRELLADIAAQGRELAAELGHRVSAAALVEVEATLHAAMADQDAGAAVTSGLLLDSLSSNGLDPVDLDGKLAVPEAAAMAPATARPKQAAQHGTPGGRSGKDAGKASREAAAARRRRARAQESLERAGQRLEDAEGRQRSAAERLEQLSGDRDQLEARIADLALEISSLRRNLARVERESADASKDAAGAGDVANRARAALEKARLDLEAEE